MRFVGQVDLPLTELGVRQAEWWREELTSKDFGQVYCSDLSRCRHTAKLVMQGRDIPIQPTPQFREIKLGEWDGLAITDVLNRYSAEWAKRQQDIAGYRCPGGESFQDLQDRVVPAFEEILQNAQKDVLIVAHAGVNRVIICHVIDIPLKNLFRIGQDYCALNIIDHEFHGIRIRAMNIRPGVE